MPARPHCRSPQSAHWYWFPGWFGKQLHNYARLLLPRLPAHLAIRAHLGALCAYTNDYVPVDTIEELVAYLLSWAASISLFRALMASLPGS